MAARFWVGGNSTWDATAGTKWALTSGGAGGQAVPLVTDTVALDNGTGTGNVTISATSTCASLTCTGYVGTLTFNAQLTVAGAVLFVSGMTISGTTGPLICTTTATLTSGGKTLTCPMTMQGTATFTLSGAWVVNGLLTVGGTTLTTTINASTLNAVGGVTQAGSTSIITGTTALTISGGTWSSTQTTGALRLSTTLAGNVTLSGTVAFNTGTLTYASGTLAGASSPVLSIAVGTTLSGFSGSTAATGQMQWGVNIGASITLTITTDLRLTGAFAITGAFTCTMSGAFNLYCGSFTTAGTTSTMALSGTLTATGDLTLASTTSTTFTGSFNIFCGSVTISGTETVNIQDGTGGTNGIICSGLTTISDATVMNSAAGVLSTASLTTTGSLSGTSQVQLSGGGTWTGAAGTLSNSVQFTGSTTVSGTVLYNTGTIQWAAGTITTTSSTLSLGGSCTLDSGGGVTWNNITITAAATITLTTAMFATGTLTCPNAALTFSGSGGFTVGTLANTAISVAARTYTFAAALTYTVTGAFNLSGATAALTLTLISSHATNKVAIVVLAGATQDVGYVNPTRIDSSAGQQVFTYKGVITTTFNWTSTYPFQSVGGSRIVLASGSF